MVNQTSVTQLTANVDSVDLAWPKRQAVSNPHCQTYIQARMSDGEGNWQTLVNVKGLTLAQKQTFLELSSDHAIRCIGYFTEPETHVMNNIRNRSIRNFDFLDFEYEKDSKGEVKTNEEGDRIPQTVPLILDLNTKHA